MINHKKLIEVALPLEAINKASAPGEVHSSWASEHVAPVVCAATAGSSAGGHLHPDECTPRVLHAPPFHREPDFGVTSVNHDFRDLLTRGKVPT
jgi:hypothetical protein